MNIKGPFFKECMCMSQIVSSFSKPTVKECQLSILKQTYKICGPNGNSLTLSVARQMMHTFGTRCFPAG